MQLALKNFEKNCEKHLTIFDFFVAPVSFKTSFFSQNNPIGQQVQSLSNVRNVLIHEIL